MYFYDKNRLLMIFVYVDLGYAHGWGRAFLFFRSENTESKGLVQMPGGSCQH